MVFEEGEEVTGKEVMMMMTILLDLVDTKLLIGFGFEGGNGNRENRIYSVWWYIVKNLECFVWNDIGED